MKSVRILCLHAFHQNDIDFTRRTTLLRAELDFIAEFVFTSAPNLAPFTPEEGLKNRIDYERYRSNDALAKRCWWWQNADGTDMLGFSESLAQLKRVWKESGPFDAIMGLTQGATMALLFAIELASLPAPHTLTVPRFLILIAGYISDAPCHDGFLERLGGKLPFPSLHVTGESDTFVKRFQSNMLAEWFKKEAVLMLEHEGGNVVPQGRVHLKYFYDFVKRFHDVDATSIILPGYVPPELEDIEQDLPPDQELSASMAMMDDMEDDDVEGEEMDEDLEE